MTPLAVAGTTLWLIAAAVLWLNMDAPESTGRGWWLDCALYGAALGVPGTIVMLRHDRKRSRGETDEGSGVDGAGDPQPPTLL